MTDDELKQLLESLKPTEKTRWQTLMDNTLGVLIGTLTVGFFALLWQSRNDADRRVGRLEARMDDIEQSVKGAKDIFTKEIGDLAATVTLQASIKEAVVEQNKALQELDSRFHGLEQQKTNGLTFFRTNIAAIKPELVPVVKGDDLIKAVRSKEDSIDQKLRSYEQRSVPKN